MKVSPKNYITNMTNKTYEVQKREEIFSVYYAFMRIKLKWYILAIGLCILLESLRGYPNMQVGWLLIVAIMQVLVGGVMCYFLVLDLIIVLKLETKRVTSRTNNSTNISTGNRETRRKNKKKNKKRRK